MRATIIAPRSMQQRTTRLRHRPRTFSDKIGKVKRLSDEKRPISGDSSDQLAAALASMSSGGDVREPPAQRSPVDEADDQTIAPAPTVANFVHKKPAASDALERAIKTRRTMIPV